MTTGTRTSNWARWGPDDQAGTGNLFTPEVVRQAVGLVTEGRVLSLAVPIRASKLPQFAGRPPVIHTMRWDAGDFWAAGVDADSTKSADDYIFTPVHGTTHVDALAHAWYGEELYNGVSQKLVRSGGARRLGAEHLRPMVGRGVLLDAVRFLDAPPAPGDPITRTDVEQILDAQGVTLQPGDIVLVRTGWLKTWQAASAADKPGLVDLEQGLHADTVDLFVEADTAAVGTDNVTLEVWPDPEGRNTPFHRRMIRDYGVYLMELLDLEALAESGRFEFLFVGAPLPISGGTGSPLNPLAVL
ncbi:MAG TPA: cyclase family protein [Solirubrobacter sp.]|nr:cyclase family protein [Solirubrobacter sp.]